MKKKAMLAAIGFMLLSGAAQAVTPLAPHAHASAVTLLRLGTSGTAVTLLQTDLKKLGYFSATATGYYGTVTRDAVTRFQRDYGLAADGIAGPVTLEAVKHAILKQKLVADTSFYIGVPYLWGGSNPATGFDCSGFIYFMFTKFGVSQTRTTSANLFTQGFAVNKSMLRPGDLVFFRNPSTGAVDHAGFYTGGGSFVSALSSKGIYVQQLDNSYWGPRYAGARRVY
ncbi:C40 family peptidase [Paenibacillus montanisoli]|uniref:Hydrolase Nlp/P60 n=1 Tax=Paenibacillus montanisoli TaxID=2081970 RepID=A0A328U0X2_9BACL|nr:C40 family peptidase [Paenibacillus montanisoli]RAP75091.1 hydrolase Nlp/P60 [Paenibacillus montanisoli]